MPSTDGVSGNFLITNGSGTLSWAAANLTPIAPTNYALPVVSGTTTVGQTLSSTTGGWNGYPAPTYAYQWVRGVSNIGGATSATYPLVDADYNNTIKVIVTATNSAGSANATSNATATIAGTVPGAPTIGTATAGNAQASVAFTAPAVTGGPSITSFTATSNPSGITGSAASSPITVSGLTNGTAYTFTVTATNSIGTGAASSASNSVTPTLIVQDPSFSYVPLLLETTSTNGQQNNTFLDSSTNNFTITRNGTPTQGSITPYWPNGQWSNYFSSGNYASTSSAPITSTTSTFTIECWVFPTAASVTPNGTPAVVGDMTGTSAANYFAFGLTSGNLVQLYWTDGVAKFATGNTTIALNTWTHIAVSVNSNAISLYVNGNQQTITGTSTLTNRSSTNNIFTIGQWNSINYYTGYVSNLSVLNAVAKYSTGFTPATSPLSPSTANQTLLTCYSNRFIDANTATAEKTITVVGTVTVQAFQPFSPAAAYTPATYAGSVLLPTSSDYLTIAADATFTLGTANHTVEFWAYQTSYNAFSTFWAYAGTTANQNTDSYLISNGSSGSNLLVGAGGSWGVNIAFTQQKLNAWHHYAITRSGSSWALFIDGTRAGTATYAGSVGAQTQPMAIGRASGTSDTLQGYISNLRISKGVAVYDPAQTTIFVPTVPLTTTTGGSTPPSGAQCILLVNGANAGIYDAAAQNVITTVGNAQVSSTITPQWGTTSMKFDGASDYLTMPANPTVTFGSGNFTIEFWQYYNSLTGYQTISSQGYVPSVSGGWLIQTGNGDGKINFYYQAPTGTLVAAETGTTVTTGVWYYIAIVKSGSTTTIYRNGTNVGSGSDTRNYSLNSELSIGGGSSTGFNNFWFNGYIQDFRITKGVARTITASPTAPFPVQ